MIQKICISSLRLLTLYLIFALLIISSVPSSSSAMFISPGSGNSVFDSIGDIAKVKDFLEARIVQQRLADFGLTSTEISSRLNQLSPDQLHHIAAHIDQIDYGGDDALGAIITILVIVVLVIVILKLMGRQVVIK